MSLTTTWLRRAFFSTALLAVNAPGQDDLRRWAMRILDPPGTEELDPDAQVLALLTAIEREPRHPGAYTALRHLQLLAETHDLREPTRLAEFLERMREREAELPGPLAARLSDLRPTWTQDRASALPSHPEDIDAFLFLGPFGDDGPGQIARAFRPEWDLRESVVYEGSHGEITGRVVTRGRHQALAFPGEHVHPRAAVGYLATTIVHDEGGLGHLRLRFRGEIKVFWNQRVLWSSLEWGPERFGLDEVWLPIVYRRGDNQLLLKLADLGEGAVAVRPCDEHGHRAALVDQPRVARDGALPPELATARPTPLVRPSELWQRAAAGLDDPHVAMAIAWEELFEGSASEAIERARAVCERTPEDARLHWHLARLYELAGYLPTSYRSARAQEALDRALALEPGFAPAQLDRARFLSEQDRTEDALAIVAGVAERLPTALEPALLEARLYASLGWSLEMGAALDRALDRVPRSARAWLQRSALAAANGDFRLEIQALENVVALRPDDQEVRARLAERLARAGRVEEAIAQRRILVETAPHRTTWRTNLANLLSEVGRHEEAIAIFDELCREFPQHPDFERWKGWMLVLHGEETRGFAALERSLALEPGQPSLVESFRDRGRDLGRSLFERYREDPLAHVRAFDLRPSDRNASDVLVIDIMIDRLHADGSLESETQQLWYLRDRNGVNVHGEKKPVRGETIAVRTIRPDGTYAEPLPIQGAFTLPDLAPGHFVEVHFREFEGPARFDRPRLSSFFFGSEEKPFRLTRYVLAMPAGYPVVLRTKTFQGDHTVEERDGEVIHVWERRDVERLLPERFMPPRGELIPWVDWDKPLSYESVSRRLLHNVLLASRPTREIVEWTARAIRGREGDAARAHALYDAVNERVKERTNEGSAVGALVEGRGNALALYVAGLRVLGIPWHYGVARVVLPEMDFEASPEYPRLDRYSFPLLRVLPRDAEPVWAALSEAPVPYGRFPEVLEGCEVFLATQGSGSFAFLPRLDAETIAQGILEVDLEIEEDGGARVRGRMSIPATAGYTAKHLLRQAPVTMQQRWAVQRATALVPGLQVEGVSIERLAVLDHPLEVRFEGRIARFLETRAGIASSRLPLRPLNLLRTFGGEARRSLPLDLPGLGQGVGTHVDVVRVRITPGPEREVVRPPRAQHLRFAGLTYALDAYEDGGRLTLERRFRLSPARIDPTDYERFLEGLRAIDDAEETRIHYR